ncbi:hypothetical protein [Comamonas thiooxydans]|uniref:hypothetical protein n=1 Tax=Comamonas thiooxydans TaxID=363952 RepID=UPI00209C1D99|nr:hypothetical protein [Comamonas thiooxydans]MCO8248507.1 hypothetical protein [Comamonas thiooxydans]
MGRTPTKTQEPVTDVVVSQGAVTVIEKTQDALAVEDQQMQARVRAVALQVGYQLPGDCIDPDLIQRDIAANMRRSVEACLEVGRGLTALKAACQHGNFTARLEVLGLDRTVAWKFMQSATKFSNVSSNQHLTKAIGNQTKLFEMLVLDDEQIDELALTGETGELKLDDIATMSVKELRSTLRQAKEDNKFLAEKRDKEQQRADKAEKALRSGGPQARSLEERVADFSATVNLQQDVAMDALLVMDQQIKALDTWYLEYAAQQPGYEPGDRVEMPVEVLALVQKLCSNVNRIAANVGSLQHLIGNTFGHELEAVTTYQMKTPALAPALEAGQAEGE